MSLRPETIEVQSKLARYCRDGKAVEIDGSLDKRLPHYRRLVYNVMYGIMEKAFPITKSILTEAEFNGLIDDYLVNHNATESQVWKVPGEFCEYMLSASSLPRQKYPYLDDLLRMEWTEILVYNRENSKVPNSKSTLLGPVLVLNPEYEILELEYPVFKGDWSSVSAKKGKYYLLIFRHMEELKVHFMEISALHRILIEQLQNGKEFKTVISELSSAFSEGERELVNTNLTSFLNTLYSKGFILGSSVTQ